jgi:hypothetical protein
VIYALDRSGIAVEWVMAEEPWHEQRIQSDLLPLFYALLLGHPIEFHFHFLDKVNA